MLWDVRKKARLVGHVAARAHGSLDQARCEPSPGPERYLQRVCCNEQRSCRDQGFPALRRVIYKGADERHQYGAAQPRHRRDERDRRTWRQPVDLALRILRAELVLRVPHVFDFAVPAPPLAVSSHEIAQIVVVVVGVGAVVLITSALSSC